MIWIIALLLMMTPAYGQSAKLPDRMLGAWCGSWGYQFPDAEDTQHWWRTPNVEDCANRGGILLRKNGYDYYRFGPLGSCRYTQIKFSRHGKPEDHVRPRGADGTIADAKPGSPSDVYLAEATCKHGAESWNDSYFVQTTDDWLIRDEPKGD
jgi:hypothetical protein